MRPEAQRIAIAEACGIKVCWPHDYEDRPWGTSEWGGPTRGYIHHSSQIATCKKCGKQLGRLVLDTLPETIPDYLNDPNAMHEAEKTLSYCEQMNFIDALLAIIKNEPDYDIDDDFCSDDGWSLVSATAAQRAEAFLKTKNLWKN